MSITLSHVRRPRYLSILLLSALAEPGAQQYTADCQSDPNESADQPGPQCAHGPGMPVGAADWASTGSLQNKAAADYGDHTGLRERTNVKFEFPVPTHELPAGVMPSRACGFGCAAAPDFILRLAFLSTLL